MATRDGAKKWLRRAIQAGRIVRPKSCQYCQAFMPQGAMAYQAEIKEPWKIQWVCQGCMSNVTQLRGSLPADAYSTEKLVKKVLAEAEAAMMMRYQQLEAGLITQEQANEDEKMWDERVAVATSAYAAEQENLMPRMVSVDGVKKQVEELEEPEPEVSERSVFDLLG